MPPHPTRDYDARVVRYSKIHLDACLDELGELNPSWDDAIGALMLATEAVAIAEMQHPEKQAVARLMKARWLRAAVASGACDAGIIYPEVRYQLSKIDPSPEMRHSVALEQAGLFLLGGDIAGAAQSALAVVGEAPRGDPAQVPAHLFVASLLLNHSDALDGRLSSALRDVLDARAPAVSASLADRLALEAAMYLLYVATPSSNGDALRAALIAVCENATDPAPQIVTTLNHLAHDLCARDLWDDAIRLHLAVASSGAVAHLRALALANAYRIAGQSGGIPLFETVREFGRSQVPGITASATAAFRDATRVQIALAQLEGSLSLVYSAAEPGLIGAHPIADESVGELVAAFADAKWPEEARETKEAFQQQAAKLTTLHEELLKTVSNHTLDEISKSRSALPSPTRHPSDLRDTRWAASATHPQFDEDAVSPDAGSPQTSTARQIGILAENIFAGACSALGWIVSKTPQESDYGIDFRIEPVFGRQVPGMEFFAQVKGTKQASGFFAPSIGIKASVASYWRAKLVPVAVVLVDVGESRLRYGWFDGTEGRDTATVTVKLANEFPDGLVADLEQYYKSIRTDVVSSAALDSMLEAASVISFVVSEEAAIDTYPDLAEMQSGNYEDTKYSVREINAQGRRLLLSGAVGILRRPHIGVPDSLDEAIADMRREVVSVCDSFMMAGVYGHHGLSNGVRGSIGMWRDEAFEYARPYLAYASSRLAMELAMARSNLTRERLAQLAS